MSGGQVRGVVGVLLRTAVRCWPPALREEQCREWTAELEALRGEPQSGLRRFTFALSLAVSPAPDDGSGLRGWRELLPGIGERLRPAAGFAVLSLLVMQLLPLRFNPTGYVSEDGRRLLGQLVDPVPEPTFPNIPVGALLAWLIVPLCFLIGRRSSVPAANPVGIAGVVTTGAALGYLIYRTAPLLAISGPTLPHAYVAASLIFVALMTPLLAGVLWLAVRRRWTDVVALAIPGMFVVAILSLIVGRAASPGPYYDGMRFDPFTSIMGSRFDRGPFGLGVVIAETSLAGALFLVAAFLIAYVLGLSTRERVRAATPAVAPTPPAGPWSPSRAVTVVGMTAIGIGLAVWSYTTSTLASQAGRAVSPEWVDELSWGCVILAALGVRAAAVRRRGATLAALVLGGWLLAAEAVLARLSLTDVGLLPGSVEGVLAAVGGALAWLISGPRVRLGAPEAAAVRRALAVTAVAAAACGPLLIINVHTTPSAPSPAMGLPVVIGIVPATFVALAALAAAAARRRPISPALVALLAVLPVAVMAAGCVAATATRIDQNVMLLVGAVGAGLLAVGSAALALAGGARPAETKAGWAVAAVLAPFVLAPVALYTAIIPGILLRAIGGAESPYSVAMSFQPGVLLVVVPAAAALARWLTKEGQLPNAERHAGSLPDIGLAAGCSNWRAGDG